MSSDTAIPGAFTWNASSTPAGTGSDSTGTTPPATSPTTASTAHTAMVNTAVHTPKPPPSPRRARSPLAVEPSPLCSRRARLSMWRNAGELSSTYEYSPSEEDAEESPTSTSVSSNDTPPWYLRPEDAAGGGLALAGSP